MKGESFHSLGFRFSNPPFPHLFRARLHLSLFSALTTQHSSSIKFCFDRLPLFSNFNFSINIRVSSLCCRHSSTCSTITRFLVFCCEFYSYWAVLLNVVEGHCLVVVFFLAPDSGGASGCWSWFRALGFVVVIFCAVYVLLSYSFLFV